MVDACRACGWKCSAVLIMVLCKHGPRRGRTAYACFVCWDTGDTKGDLTPGCSATRFVDVKLIGWAHMYDSGEFARSTWCSSCSPMACPKKLLCPAGQKCPEPTHASPRAFLFTNNCSEEVGGCAANWCAGRLDPEGTLSSMPAVFTTYIGFHFGITLAYFSSHRDRLSQWVPQSLALIVLGLLVQTSWYVA
eukprot:m.172092 g.172092  ORF g.172092 m.172092 type:complete len:192 (-) comp18282_c0_seq56:2937-3512(-)